MAEGRPTPDEQNPSIKADAMECDLLVLGAGMAGLSAAARAAEDGARVVVVEKAREIGGSAIISGGYVWTVPTHHKMQYVGRGDPLLNAVVVGGYAEAIAWLRSRSVQMSSPVDVLDGRGYQVDIIGHLRSCVASVRHAGGEVVTGTFTDELVLDGSGRVIGASTSHPDGKVRVLAKNTVIATGGFQASAELRAEFIHSRARNIALRSNPESVGDGLRLALQAGGCRSAGSNPGFYGHLLCEPARLDHHSKFVLLAQLHSEAGVLLNRSGQRFCDESLGDHLNSQEVLLQPDAQALLVWDQRVDDVHVKRSFVEGMPPVDKLAVAVAQGARGAACPTLDDLLRHATMWGFDGMAVRATLEKFSDHVRHAPEKLNPPRTRLLEANDAAPYRALVVQPAITFTHAGIAADDMARVVNPAGVPVPGLLAAGVDIGNIYSRGYAGGLAAAITFGMRAAKTAAGG